VEVSEAENAGEGVSALDLFVNRFGRDRVSNDVFEDDLHGWPFANLGRSMIYSEMQAALAIKNTGASAENVISFERVCGIEYRDGAKMTTLVGIFCSAEDISTKLQSCDFLSLDFLPSDQKAIRIEVPKLTLREIRNLERQLPISSERLELGTIPGKDARRFASLYRYLPNFAVIEG
jgi:Putative O-methyltransferase